MTGHIFAAIAILAARGLTAGSPPRPPAGNTLPLRRANNGNSRGTSQGASPKWGSDAERIAKIWGAYAEGYSHYPLSNGMQYYGPMHAGVVWPLSTSE